MSLRDFGADESADEMLAVNPDYHNLVELLGAARNDMVMRLAEALTITRDASLRERLAEIVAIEFASISAYEEHLIKKLMILKFALPCS